MELGGNAPVLVFEDADVVAAAEACATAKFRNCGQVCASPSRFFVQEAAYDTFSTRFAEVARALKLGRYDEPRVNIVPLANTRRPVAGSTK